MNKAAELFFFVSLLLMSTSAGAVEKPVTLHSSSGLEVLAGDLACKNWKAVTVRSEHPDMHYSGSFSKVQEALIATRDGLLAGCPTLRGIEFLATGADGKPIYEGEISKARGWQINEVWEYERNVRDSHHVTVRNRSEERRVNETVVSAIFLATLVAFVLAFNTMIGGHPLCFWGTYKPRKKNGAEDLPDATRAE